MYTIIYISTLSAHIKLLQRRNAYHQLKSKKALVSILKTNSCAICQRKRECPMQIHKLFGVGNAVFCNAFFRVFSVLLNQPEPWRPDFELSVWEKFDMWSVCELLSGMCGVYFVWCLFYILIETILCININFFLFD